MRVLLSRRQVREMTTLSSTQTDRLEKDEKFPKRVKLGQSRVAWVESEVMEWVQKRIDERDNPTDPSR